jgi:hypothetical protein
VWYKAYLLMLRCLLVISQWGQLIMIGGPLPQLLKHRSKHLLWPVHVQKQGFGVCLSCRPDLDPERPKDLEFAFPHPARELLMQQLPQLAVEQQSLLQVAAAEGATLEQQQQQNPQAGAAATVAPADAAAEADIGSGANTAASKDSSSSSSSDGSSSSPAIFILVGPAAIESQGRFNVPKQGEGADWHSDWPHV